MFNDKLVDMVIKGGRVVTPAGTCNQWVAVDGGKIVAIGSADISAPKAKRTIDVTGKYVLPGLIDNEHHPNINPSDESILSETRAAVAAGITTVGLEHASPVFAYPEDFIEFPKPEEVPTFMQVLPNIRDWETKKNIMTDYFFTPVLANDKQVKEIPDLAKEHGVTSFKFYLHCMGGEHMWDMWGAMKYLGMHYYDDGTVYRAMQNIASLGPPAILALHCENWNIARVLKEDLIAEGRSDPQAWHDHSPDFTETGHVRTYAYYAKITKCPILIRHVTVPGTFDEIRKARAEGVSISGNTSHHYLLFDSIWRTNVPYRPKEYHPLMWEALRTGIIDTVSSDHVYLGLPLEKVQEIEKSTGTIEEVKTAGTMGDVGIKYPFDIFKGPSQETLGGVTTRDVMKGRTGTLAPIMLSEGVNKGRLSIERFVEVMSTNSAKKFGLYPQKGIIAIGSDADFTIVDLEKSNKIKRNQVYDCNGWSIFEGWVLKGWPVMSIIRGNVIMEWPDEEARPKIVGEPMGKYLPRKLG